MSDRTAQSGGLHARSGSEPGLALENHLRRQIAEGALPAGTAIPSLRRLADDHGVSFAVARGVVAKLKQAELLDSQHGRGVFVTPDAASRCGQPTDVEAATGATGLVGVLGVTRGHVFGNLWQHLQQHLSRAGRFAVPVPIDQRQRTHASDARRLVASTLGRQPDVWVVVSYVGMPRRAIEACCGDTPVVTIFRGTHVGRVGPNIQRDQTRIFQFAVQHLAPADHEKMALLVAGRYHHDKLKKSRDVPATRVFRCFDRVVRHRGGGAKATLLRQTKALRTEKDTLGEEGLAQMAEQLERHGRPTALIGSDFRIVSAIRAYDRLGWKLGRDFQAVGIGRTPWSRAFHFPSVPLREAAAADLAARLIAEPGPGVFDPAVRPRFLVAPGPITPAPTSRDTATPIDDATG